MILSVRNQPLQSGFSLITMSIVLTAAALIFVSVLPGQDYNKQLIDNNSKLEKIDEATRSFMVANGRRPCPADGQYAVNSPNFGMEASSPGTCTGGAIQAPLTGGNLVGGVIPTKALGLPDDYAVDAFGHRFTYIVDKRATSTSGCQALTKGGVTIQDGNGSTLGNSMYAYISHGKSGFGAWPAQGGTNRIYTGTTDAAMLTDGATSQGTTQYQPGWASNGGTLVQKARTKTYDDMVWYRPDMANICALGAFAAAGHCDTASPGGSLDSSFSPVTLPGSGTGSSITAFANSTGSCAPHTLACTNGTLACDGSGTLTNCEYSSCSATNCATASPSGPLAASFSPASISPGPGVTAWPNSSDATCTSSHALTCSGGVLYCDGSTTLTNCEYSSCTVPPSCSTAGLGTGFTPASLPGMGPNNTATAWPNSSDPTCSPSHTLACNSGALTCDGSPTLTNCEYSTCVKSCATAAPAGPLNTSFSPTSIPGSGPTSTMSAFASNSGTCTSHTLACTNGTLACDGSGTLTNCMYSSCAFDTKVNGTAANGATGWAVAVGDINGDGYADLVIGAPYTGTGGKVYVLLGGPAGLPTSLSSLNGTNGFELDGTSSGPSTVGTSVAVGDVNGDGYDDIIIGTPTAPTAYGYTYVVFGNAVGGVVKKKDGTAWAAAQALNAGTGGIINGINGVRFDDANAPPDFAGESVAVGDINGDGKKDIIIGAPYASYTNFSSGSVFLVYGANPLLPVTTVTTVSGSTSAIVTSATGLIIGQTVAATGIPAGTTITAIAGNTITLSNAATASGSSTLSVATVLLNSSYINGANGFRLDGVNVNDQIGSSVAAGDIDGVVNGGNKVDDMVIGTPFPPNGNINGAVYVVYGHADSGVTHEKKDGTAWSTTNTISTICNATNGITLLGAAANNDLGSDVTVGDINGDGYPDIIVSGTLATAGGSAYVVFGGADVGGKPAMKNGTAWSPFSNSLAPSNAATGVINGLNGVRFDGQKAGDGAGSSVATGDFNGAGIKDIIIGAQEASYGATNSGSAYVIFGKNPLLPQPTITTNVNPGNQTCATVSSPTGLIAGQTISSANVPAGTTITTVGAACGSGAGSCSGASCITMSANATAAGAGTAMQIASVVLDTNFINGTNGFRLDDNTANELLGGPFDAIASGDFNGAKNGGNNLNGLAIGAWGANSGAGAVFIINGETSGWSATNTLQ